MSRRRVLIPILVLCLIGPLAAVGSASQSISSDGRVQGESYVSSYSQGTANVYGVTYIAGDLPSWGLVQMDLFDKNGYRVSFSQTRSDFSASPWIVTKAGSASCEQYVEMAGWHRADYRDGSVSSCTTYDLAGSKSLAASPRSNADIGMEIAEQILSADPGLAKWSAVSYADSSSALRGLLGDASGTRLDVLFHSDLHQYLEPGDAMPVISIRQDNSVAKALFLHDDGTVTVITVLADSSEWQVTDVMRVADSLDAAGQLSSQPD